MKATRKEIQDANELIRLMWPSLTSHLQYRFRHALGTIECAINEIHELKVENMGCNLTEHVEENGLDINVALFGQLQLMLLLNNNEKTDFIKGFERCMELVELWSKQINPPKINNN
jgi:hypothetical protein